jgi:hypothetical protein
MKSKILILAMLITFFANAQKVVRYDLLFEIPLSILQEKIKKLLRLTDKFDANINFY